MLIGQAKPADAANFRRQVKIDLPVLADESRATYRLIGARMAGVAGLVGPKVLLKGGLTLLSGQVRQGRTVGHPAALGAALVIDSDGQLLFEHRARDAGDNAPPEQMLAALGQSTPSA